MVVLVGRALDQGGGTVRNGNSSLLREILQSSGAPSMRLGHNEKGAGYEPRKGSSLDLT